MSISWTKSWSSSDDGTILTGQHLGDIQSDIEAAFGTSVLPDQTGNNGKFLTSDGSSASWSAIAEANLTLADNTTGDVSTTKHGFVPKAPNDVAKFLNGLGAWSTVLKVKVALTNIDISTTGDQTITGVGFTPKLVFCFVGDGSWAVSVGASDGSTHANVHVQGTPSFTQGSQLYYVMPSAGNYQNAVVSSFNSDGCVITKSKTGSPTGTLSFVFVYVG